MELHEQLSMAIAASDIRYVAGRLLSSAGHPRSWPFSQWGAMVAFETQKHLREVHDQQLNFDWEDDVAAAARHGGKFFDGRSPQLDSVVADFRVLAAATSAAYYPDDRRGRAFDFLRADLSVVSDGNEVLLTNVTGHFMVGLPPHRGAHLDSWGPHARTLAMGIGQMANTLTQMGTNELSEHGNHTEDVVTWWDGNIAEVIPATFGGELGTDLALAVISIHSTAQAARRWARAVCCQSCIAASLKHRFVVLHHAVRSIQQLHERAELLGPVATSYVQILSESADLQAVVSQPFRSLRNGWLHLGLGDIAAALPATPNILTPVSVYTQMEIAEFEELVDQGLNEVTGGIGKWIAEPGVDGSSLFDHLRPPSD